MQVLILTPTWREIRLKQTHICNTLTSPIPGCYNLSENNNGAKEGCAASTATGTTAVFSSNQQ